MPSPFVTPPINASADVASLQQAVIVAFQKLVGQLNTFSWSSQPATQNLSLNSNRITNVGNPGSPKDAANKSYVDKTAQDVVNNITFVGALGGSSRPTYIIISSNYMVLPPLPNDLAIGGGGAAFPNAISFTFGDNTGYALNYFNTASPAPVGQLLDMGNLGVGGIADPVSMLKVYGSMLSTAQYGAVSTTPQDLIIAGGGVFPDAASISFGDGSGYELNFINNASVQIAQLTDTGNFFALNWVGAGVGTPSGGGISFDTLNARTGNLGVGGAPDTSGSDPLKVYGNIISTALTASSPVLSNGSKELVSGQIDLTNSVHIKGTGLNTNGVLLWAGSSVSSILGVGSASLTEITAGPFGAGAITSVALTGTVPPGLTLTTTSDTFIQSFSIATHNVTKGVVVS